MSAWKIVTKVEANANDFAAELLMHQPWFVEAVKGKKLDAKLLKETANYFNVSLTAAAIRYTEFGYYPAAIVMVKEGVVCWSAIHKNFPYQFIRPKSKVGELSYAHDFFNGKDIPLEGEDIPARAWFREDFNLKDREARIWEMIIPFPRYKSAMVVLGVWE